MSRAGIERLRRIADAACDERRPPLTTEQRMQLLAQLYGATARDPDLFTTPAPAAGDSVDPISP